MKHAISTLIISAVLAGSLAAAAPAFAHGMGPDNGCAHHRSGMSGQWGGSGAGIEPMVRRLNLDSKQRDAVYAITDKHRAEMRALHDRMWSGHQQLRALIAQGAVDEAKIRALADAQGKNMADMIVLHARIRSEIGKVLTPAQREQMQKQLHGPE